MALTQKATQKGLWRGNERNLDQTLLVMGCTEELRLINAGNDWVIFNVLISHQIRLNLYLVTFFGRIFSLCLWLVRFCFGPWDAFLWWLLLSYTIVHDKNALKICSFHDKVVLRFEMLRRILGGKFLFNCRGLLWFVCSVLYPGFNDTEDCIKILFMGRSSWYKKN